MIIRFNRPIQGRFSPGDQRAAILWEIINLHVIGIVGTSNILVPNSGYYLRSIHTTYSANHVQVTV